MMINLGVGGRKTSHSGQAANGAQKEDTVGTVENGDGDLLDKVEQHINSAEGREEAQVNGDGENDIEMQDEQVDTSDASVLSTIVEEMYDRFSDDDINKILKICGEVLGGDDSNANDVREEVGNN